MAYATLDQVQSRVPEQIWQAGYTSQPAAATVEEWLDAATAWIDATLRWKYAVPITDAGDLLVVGQAAALLVAGQIWDVIGGHAADQPSGGTVLRRTAYELLAYNPREGRSLVVLPGTAESDSGEAAVGQPDSSFTDPETDEGRDRFFTMDTEW